VRQKDIAPSQDLGVLAHRLLVLDVAARLAHEQD
jgi:hypothetical protein